MIYAKHTRVPVERTRAEIERVLRAYGANALLTSWNGTQAIVAFRAQGRYVRFELQLPERTDSRFTHAKRKRTALQTQRLFDQSIRQRWRALLLAIKAKLGSVQSGIESFDDAFMAHVVLPDQSLVGTHVRLAIASAYETGKMPMLAPHREMSSDQS